MQSRQLRIARVGNYPRNSRPGMGLPAYKVTELLHHETLWICPNAYLEGWDELMPAPARTRLVEVPFPWVTADRDGRTNPLDGARRMAALGLLNTAMVPLLVGWLPDLIHVHSPMYLPAALPVARLLRVPLVLSFHGADFIRVGDRRSLRALVRQVDGVTTVSTHMLEGLREFTAEGVEPVCVGNGVDLELFVPPDASEPREDVIVAVGSLLWRKAFDVLVRAMARVHERAPRWRLKIIGEGEDREALAALVGELGLESVVSLPGAATRAEVVHAMQSAKIYALSSVTEGFPKVVLEAMACGLAVVTTDVGNAAEAVGDTGRVVPSSDVDALAGALLELVESPRALEDCSARAQERVQQYSWPACVARTQALYDSLLAAR